MNQPGYGEIAWVARGDGVEPTVPVQIGDFDRRLIAGSRSAAIELGDRAVAEHQPEGLGAQGNEGGQLAVSVEVPDPCQPGVLEA